STWEDDPIVFGAEPDGAKSWSGLLEGIRILGRSVDWDEARNRFEVQREKRQDRQPVEPIVVEAKLLIRSEAAKPGAIAPYRRCLNVNLYEIQKVVQGELSDERIAVAQWSVLDGAVVPEYEAIEEGSVQRLSIEPWVRHPEQESERKIEGDFFDDVELYYDVTVLGEEANPGSTSTGSDLAHGNQTLNGPLKIQVDSGELALPQGEARSFDANGNDLWVRGKTLTVSLNESVTLAGDPLRGEVAAITVVDGGLDYRHPPKVLLHGSGDGAKAEAGMAISSIRLTHLGEGYSSVPLVRISEPDTFGGRQAVAEGVLDPESGALKRIRLIDGGSGYLGQPTISIEGEAAKPARAEAYLSVSVVYVTQGGSGYSDPPAVEFIHGEGQGAQARAAFQSSVLQGTDATAEVQWINQGRLVQEGARILLDWAALANQPGKRRFLNQAGGEWTLRNSSIKFVSSTGRPTWYGSGNENHGIMRLLEGTWVGFSEWTNTGFLELGEGSVLGQSEFSLSDNVLRNEGRGVIRVTGGSSEDPVVFGINSLVRNGKRIVHNGSEKDPAPAQWIVGDGDASAALRITGSDALFYNHQSSLLEIREEAALMLESNDAGARHNFERRVAKIRNEGTVRFSGDLHVRSNHSGFGGIDNYGDLYIEGVEARLIRERNSVGPGGLYKCPDYTSLIAIRPGGHLRGSGSFSYVDNTGEANAHLMRFINQGDLAVKGTWELGNVNVYFGDPIPEDDGKIVSEKTAETGASLTVDLSGRSGPGALILRGENDSGHFVLRQGSGSVLNVMSGGEEISPGTYRIV
ncbi:MAG: hypothetical protein ACQKBT_12675, partial [Puniceicoccales bacterium]